MKRVVLFHFFLFLLIHTATAQSIIIIDVHEKGSAIWTMEEYLPLANQNKIDEWKDHQNKKGNIIRLVKEKL